MKVLFSTCVNATLRKSLTKSIQQLGGRVAADGDDFTHFVTLNAAKGHSDRGFKKSLNTLLALAAGTPGAAAAPTFSAAVGHSAEHCLVSSACKSTTAGCATGL